MPAVHRPSFRSAGATSACLLEETMVCTALILQKAREGLSQLSVELERPDQASGGVSG